MGLLVPVPPYLFWYRPARHALDEKKAEHELRKLDAKAASQQEDILRLKQIAIRAVDREQAKVFELQIKEASEVTQEKRQRANDFGSRMYQHEGEAFYRAEHITMWVMLIGVGLALLGLTCGLIQALRAQVMWGMLVGIAVGVLLGAAAGNFWAGYGNYHDPLVLFAGVGLFVGIICGLVVRRRAKAAGS